MSTKTVTQEHRANGITAAAPWRVRTVHVLPIYCLSVTCNDGTTGIVDMSRLISSEEAGIFAALKDEQFFIQVRIELGMLTQPNGADLDPVWLHEEIGKNKMWCVLAQFIYGLKNYMSIAGPFKPSLIGTLSAESVIVKFRELLHCEARYVRLRPDAISISTNLNVVDTGLKLTPHYG